MKFLFKLLNGFVFCPELLSSFDFFVSQFRTRSSIKNTFYLITQKSICASFAPINRMMVIANDEQIDFFNFNSVES